MWIQRDTSRCSNRYSSLCVSQVKRLRSFLVTEMYSNPRSLPGLPDGRVQRSKPSTFNRERDSLLQANQRKRSSAQVVKHGCMLHPAEKFIHGRDALGGLRVRKELHLQRVVLCLGAF